MQAVSTGDGHWKLLLPHIYRTLGGRSGGTNGLPVKYENRKIEQPELYDMHTDIGERTNIADKYPDMVRRLLAYAEAARADLGDTLTNRQGRGLREPGRVKPGE